MPGDPIYWVPVALCGASIVAHLILFRLHEKAMERIHDEHAQVIEDHQREMRVINDEILASGEAMLAARKQP